MIALLWNQKAIIRNEFKSKKNIFVKERYSSARYVRTLEINRTVVVADIKFFKVT